MPKYTPNGLPDIICLRYGKFIGFEVKLPNRNKGSRAQPYILSPHQKEMGEKIITHGGAYHVVTSLQEVVDIMNIVEVDYPELQSVK